MPDIPQDTVAVLAAASAGDPAARNRLFEIVYRELHSLAHRAMRGESPRNILQTTALVHETYLRLVPGDDARWEGREHFFRAAARAMRGILVDEARARRATKRGQGRAHLSLEACCEPPDASGRLAVDDLEELDRALEKLRGEAGDDRMATVVELMFFAGLTQEQAAEVLGVSKGTVRRDWEFAKAWLRREMTGGGANG
ncbi:MAG: sigma-70 family RNA polymerase sigma factor [Planctomycetes bacterium]|nr:sigma-70 family RNA polymerase sigma factor [Planctomycetota bacterium]